MSSEISSSSLHLRPVALKVAPQKSQFFKYESFTVSCEVTREEEAVGWGVMKRTQDAEVRLEVRLDAYTSQRRWFVTHNSPFSLLQLHHCPSACFIRAAFPVTDSGVYWCETGLGETSESVNITVSGEQEASATWCCSTRQKRPVDL